MVVRGRVLTVTLGGIMVLSNGVKIEVPYELRYLVDPKKLSPPHVAQASCGAGFGPFPVLPIGRELGNEPGPRARV